MKAMVELGRDKAMGVSMYINVQNDVRCGMTANSSLKPYTL